MAINLKSQTCFTPANPAYYKVASLQLEVAMTSEHTDDPTRFFAALVAVAECHATAELVVNNTVWEQPRDQEIWEGLYRTSTQVLERFLSRSKPMMPAQRNIVTVPLAESTKVKIVEGKKYLKRRYISDFPVGTLDEIALEYMNGSSSDDVATKFKISRNMVYKIVRERGGEVRPRGMRP